MNVQRSRIILFPPPQKSTEEFQFHPEVLERITLDYTTSGSCLLLRPLRRSDFQLGTTQTAFLSCCWILHCIRVFIGASGVLDDITDAAQGRQEVVLTEQKFEGVCH